MKCLVLATRHAARVSLKRKFEKLGFAVIVLADHNGHVPEAHTGFQRVAVARGEGDYWRRILNQNPITK